MTPLPGDIGLISMNGNAGKLIRLGQWLNGDGYSNYEHAFIYIGNGEIVEAEPGGARVAKLSEYDPKKEILWSTGLIDLTAQQRVAIVELAKSQVGTPYSFLDYFAIATARLHLPFPGVAKRVLDSKHLICSQLCAEDYDAVGSKCSEKAPYLTTPGQIRKYLLTLKGKQSEVVSVPKVGEEQR